MKVNVTGILVNQQPLVVGSFDSPLMREGSQLKVPRVSRQHFFLRHPETGELVCQYLPTISPNTFRAILRDRCADYLWDYLPEKAKTLLNYRIFYQGGLSLEGKKDNGKNKKDKKSKEESPKSNDIPIEEEIKIDSLSLSCDGIVDCTEPTELIRYLNGNRFLSMWGGTLSPFGKARRSGQKADKAVLATLIPSRVRTAIIPGYRELLHLTSGQQSYLLTHVQEKGLRQRGIQSSLILRLMDEIRHYCTKDGLPAVFRRVKSDTDDETHDYTARGPVTFIRLAIHDNRGHMIERISSEEAELMADLISNSMNEDIPDNIRTVLGKLVNMKNMIEFEAIAPGIPFFFKIWGQGLDAEQINVLRGGIEKFMENPIIGGHGALGCGVTKGAGILEVDDTVAGICGWDGLSGEYGWEETDKAFGLISDEGRLQEHVGDFCGETAPLMRIAA